MLKSLFVLDILAVLSCLFGYVEKRLDKKAMLISKFMTSDFTTNNYNTHIAQHLKQ